MANPKPGFAATIVATYDPAFRTRMTVSGEALDEPATMQAAAEALTGQASILLGSLFFSAPVGELIPERLRTLIDHAGTELWESGLLLPKTNGNHIHPRHYAGACRLNPALAQWVPSYLHGELTVSGSPPPSDARWDAMVVAERLEREPLSLTQGGAARKDQEKRLFLLLGGSPERWGLALAFARAAGLVRPSAGMLRGFPEAPIRPVDAVAVVTEVAGETVARAASLWLRILPDQGWVSVQAILAKLRAHAREALCSPGRGFYQDAFVATTMLPFDDAGWDLVESLRMKQAADLLHRCGVVGAHRDAQGVSAVQRDAAKTQVEPGFMLTPDFEILAPVAGLPDAAYARLCRLATYVAGEGIHRHRLSGASVAADIDSGHTNRMAFLQEFSRTGVPPNVRDVLQSWERQATRFTIWTGVDVWEDEDGNFSMTPPEVPAEFAVDASVPGKFVESEDGLLVVSDGSIGVKAALRQACEKAGGEGLVSSWRPVPRSHGDPDGLVERLSRYHVGALPGALEVVVRSGRAMPVQQVPARMLRMDAVILDALSRDFLVGRFLQRRVSEVEVILDEADFSMIAARVQQLGLKV